MTADLLRRAAKTLREHAEQAVVDGPWEYRDRSDDPETFPWTVWAPKSKFGAGTGFCPGTARYIALMHPPVALALAGWLDLTAQVAAATPGAEGLAAFDYPIVLARTILRIPPGVPS